MKSLLRWVGLVLALACVVPSVASAQGLGLTGEDSQLGSAAEMNAVDALDKDKLVEARELAQKLLKDDPESLAGNFVLGAVFHYAESNLPRALFYVRKARKLMEKRYGLRPRDSTGRYWFLRVISEEIYVTASMDKREEQLAALRRRDEVFDPRPSDQIWPLIKLERWDAALKMIDRGLAHEDIDQQFRAMNGLCALEFERRRREASYESCVKMTERFKYNEVGWSNTGESAMMVFKHAEAERYYLKATELPNNSYGSPWRSVAMIYLQEGRLSEALGALKKAQQQRQGREAHTHQQDQASMDSAVTTLLLALGHSDDAVRMGRRVYERPDRAGGTSASERQIQISGALLFWGALQMRIATMEEEAAAQPFTTRVLPDVDRRSLEVEAWTVQRRAVRLMAFRPELLEIIRPYLTGIVNIEVWLQGSLVSILGPGVTRQLLDEARVAEKHPEAEGYFLAIEAEAALMAGDEDEALALTKAAMKKLPRAEVLARARVAAVGGEAARREGDKKLRDRYWNQALEDFPAAFRLLDLAIPVKVEHNNTELSQDIADALLRSPRLVSEDGGLSLRIEDTGGRVKMCLYRQFDALHGCAEAVRQKKVAAKGEATPEDTQMTDEELVVEASRSFHDMIMSPKLDLTQADIRSLDGSPSTGRARRDMDSLLDDMSK